MSSASAVGLFWRVRCVVNILPADDLLRNAVCTTYHWLLAVPFFVFFSLKNCHPANGTSERRNRLLLLFVRWKGGPHTHNGGTHSPGICKGTGEDKKLMKQVTSLHSSGLPHSAPFALRSELAKLAVPMYGDVVHNAVHFIKLFELEKFCLAKLFAKRFAFFSVSLALSFSRCLTPSTRTGIQSGKGEKPPDKAPLCGGEGKKVF